VEVIYSTRAKEDKEYWLKTSDKMIKRIDKLITDIQRHPLGMEA
jgi:Txe/YoeB family toxin of Txe-Axe toxin-antitoxin module